MLRLVFVAMAFLSGAVALSHELLWTRRLIDLLGATQDVTGRVLGLFFLGLSLGGWLATRWNKTNQNSAIRLGIAELSIAVLSLPALLAFLGGRHCVDHGNGDACFLARQCHQSDPCCGSRIATSDWNGHHDADVHSGDH